MLEVSFKYPTELDLRNTVVTNVNTPIRLKFVFFPPPFQT